MAIQDEAYNKFFGWVGSQGNAPMTSGSGSRETGEQDIIQATFDPSGKSHTKYAADLAAAEQAKIDAANQKAAEAKYAADLKKYEEDSARIAAENAAKLAQQQADYDAQVAAADAATYAQYAKFYALPAGGQQKARARPIYAGYKGITLPPAGYTPPTGYATVGTTGLGARPTSATGAAALPAAPTAVAAAPTGPTTMGLGDYDAWMKELVNQSKLSKAGYGNITFWDPQQMSQTEWAESAGKKDAYKTGKEVWEASKWSGYSNTTKVDPTTGRIVEVNGKPTSGAAYAYGVPYKPQTGDASKDWVALNMAHGIMPSNTSQWTKLPKV